MRSSPRPKRPSLPSTSEMVRKIVNHEIKNLCLSIQLELSELKDTISGSKYARVTSLAEECADAASALIGAIQEFNSRIQHSFDTKQTINMAEEIRKDDIPIKSEELEKASQRLSRQITKDAKKFQTPGRDIRRTSIKITGIIETLASIFEDNLSSEPFRPMQFQTVARDVLGAIPRMDRTRVNLSDSRVPAVLANSDQIFIAILNLTQNALTHHIQGQKSRVWISADILKIADLSELFPFVDESLEPKEDLDDWFCVFVKDDGRGIPERKIGSIFRPLVRLDESGKKVKDDDVDAGKAGDLDQEVLDELRHRTEIRGKGIGLTLVRLIAESHDGLVTVRPNSPSGSEFLLAFPARYH